MTNATTEYIGHRANSGGLQGHSIGGEYPYLVYLRGTNRGEFWAVLDTRTSEDVALFNKQEEAIEHVYELKGASDVGVN